MTRHFGFLSKIFYIFFLAVIPYLVGASELESDPLDKIRASYGKFKLVKGHFKQQKHIKKLNISLVSNGAFEMTREKFVWLQESPIRGRYEINKNGIKQKIGDEIEESISRKNVPEIAMLSDIMICVLNGDKSCLKKNFHYKNTKNKKGRQWTLSLVPKSPWLKKVMSQMKLKGKTQHIETIQILEKSGNSSKISFSDVQGE